MGGHHGVAIEVNGQVVEDASWLRFEDASSHINMEACVEAEEAVSAN